MRHLIANKQFFWWVCLTTALLGHSVLPQWRCMWWRTASMLEVLLLFWVPWVGYLWKCAAFVCICSMEVALDIGWNVGHFSSSLWGLPDGLIHRTQQALWTFLIQFCWIISKTKLLGAKGGWLAIHIEHAANAASLSQKQRKNGGTRMRRAAFVEICMVSSPPTLCARFYRVALRLHDGCGFLLRQSELLLETKKILLTK